MSPTWTSWTCPRTSRRGATACRPRPAWNRRAPARCGRRGTGERWPRGRRVRRAPQAIPLLEPRDGLPPVVETSAALAEVTDRLAQGEGPVAVDAERASGYRYGQRAYLVQLRRAGAGTVLIDPIAVPGLYGVDAALAGHRGRPARGVTGPALPRRARLPAPAAVRHRTGRAAARVPQSRPRHAGRGGARVPPGEGPFGGRLVGPPAAEELLRYAALDVEVLIELRDALAAELADQGKTEWARQEFEAVLAARPATARADPWRRTSGIHRVAIAARAGRRAGAVDRSGTGSPRPRTCRRAASCPIRDHRGGQVGSGQHRAADADRRVRGPPGPQARAGVAGRDHPGADQRRRRTARCRRRRYRTGRRPRIAGPSATRPPPRAWPRRVPW